MVFFADGSAGDVALLAATGQSVDFYIDGTKEMDYATGAMAFQQATTISTAAGDLTLSPFGNVVLSVGKGIFGSADDNYLIYGGGTDINGALLVLSGKTRAGAAGNLYVYTPNAALAQTLRLTLPGGANAVPVTWNGINGMSFDQATTISTTAGNLTLSASAGNDVLIGDDVTILYVGGGWATVGMNIAANIDIGLYLFKDWGEMGAADKTLITSSNYAAETTGPTAQKLIGFSGTAHIAGSAQSVTNTQNWTATVGLIGMRGGVAILAGASGTITGGAAFYALNAVVAAGTLTNQYGLYVEALTTATNNYGVYIGTPTGTIADAIHVVGGRSYFGGNVYLNLTLEAGADGVGAAGEQLTSGGAAAQCTWTAAASRREWKNDLGIINPRDALDVILGTVAVHRFTYKLGYGTGDYETEYVGVFADEAPWAMHFGETIINPVNTLGYMILGFQAQETRFSTVEDRLSAVEKANKILRSQLVAAGIVPGV